MLAAKLNLCFQDLFESQASTSPDAVAVLCGSEQISYGELSHRTDKLALHLQALGVKPNTLVGICVERSLDMIVGILGVLKSGAAYVPLDPAYPHERLSFILQDANIQVVVTQPKLFDTLADEIPHVVCVGEVLSWSTQQAKASLKREVSVEDLAYVIYTSGSTGKPKGVMVTHENLSHFVEIASQVLDVTADDVYLQTASISYALSVRQLMVPLAHGATLVIADSEQMRDPLLLFQLIREQHISLIDMVPSFWRTCLQSLLALPWEEQRMLLDNRLRRIVSIGEALLSDIPRDWRFKLGHNAGLVNIFGQTETTGVVATYPIPVVNKNEIETVPIGWSVPDTKLYILDANLQPVPAGETGELCVSSPCVARGYLNRPELTAQKFMQNPFDDTAGTRFYRTGDMARQRADGAIEFLGRSDFQVKIRGQRLELGEVEAVLLECPWVQACVVVAQGEHPDQKHLVAFIVPVAGQEPTALHVRQYMKQRVPDYMVPSTILFLDTFPLTPNGKLDRLALSNPAFVSTIAAKAQTRAAKQATKEDGLPEAGNQIERTLVDIWQELLKVKQVGIHDNFFDLGGDSLDAASLLISIETTLGKRLSVSTLFKGPTIAQLAEAIGRNAASPSEAMPKGTESLIPIHVGESSKLPFFWLHGSDFAYVKPHLDPSQPFYCIMPSGLNEGEAILEDEDAIAEHHLRAIQAQCPTGPYLLGGYCNGGKNAIAVALRLIERGYEVRLLALVDVPVPDRQRIEEGERPIFGRVTEHIKRRRFWDVANEKFWDRFGRISSLLTNNTYMQRFTKITQAHDRVFKYYVMPRPFPGKIFLFTCQDQYEIAKDELDRRWGKLATQGIRQHIIPGNHTTMIRKPNIQTLGEKLKQAIAEAQTLKP
jgi:aspartate racemase